MISEKISKQGFVIQVLERDVQNIYKAQLAIVLTNIYVSGKTLKVKKRPGPNIGVRSGSLLASLQNPDYLIQAQGEKFIVSAGIVKHMRFLDMKKYGNRKIYNRQLWGILYNNALKDLKYHYGKEIYDYLGKRLHDIFRSEYGTSSGKKKNEPNLIDYARIKGRES